MWLFVSVAGVVVAAVLDGLSRGDGAVRRGGPRAGDRVRHVERAHGAHAQMGQVLQFGQVGQFQEERVDDDPAEDAEQDQHDPDEAHGDVVAEDHVVDDRREADGHDAPQEEDGRREQPRHHLRFDLLRFQIENNQRADDCNHFAHFLVIEIRTQTKKTQQNSSIPT